MDDEPTPTEDAPDEPEAHEDPEAYEEHEDASAEGEPAGEGVVYEEEPVEDDVYEDEEVVYEDEPVDDDYVYEDEPAEGEETVVTVDEGLEERGGGPSPEELEASLNDLAATLTSLSQNIQEIKSFRDEMEDRLSEVEDRMVRLGSLAEAVSMQYNPFLAEDAPDGPVGDGTDRVDLPDVGSQGNGSGADRSSQPDRADDGPDPAKGTDRAVEDPPSLTTSTDGDSDSDRLERRMLLMEWVKFLMERVGRVGLLDVLEYYEELGWLDERIKDQVLQVAVGVDGPERVDGADWKGDRELHERSLIALERLKGREVTGQTLDSIHLDLDRLFDG